MKQKNPGLSQAKRKAIELGKRPKDRSRLNSGNIPEMARRTPNEITKGRFALYAASSTFAARTLSPIRGTGLCGSDEPFIVRVWQRDSQVIYLYLDENQSRLARSEDEDITELKALMHLNRLQSSHGYAHGHWDD